MCYKDYTLLEFVASISQLSKARRASMWTRPTVVHFLWHDLEG